MELLVLMVFEKCCPHKDIRDLDMLGNTLCVSLAGTHSTQHTTLVGDRVRSLCRRILLADSVECVFQLWSSILDIFDNIRVIVIENMSGSEFLDQIKVSRTASGDDVEPVQRGDLNGILSNARYTRKLAVVIFPVSVLTATAPDQNTCLCFLLRNS